MLKILCPDSPRDTKHLSEMHHLRFKKFIQQLGWKDGLYSINQMEFDCFDHGKAFYLVNTNNDNVVDTVARLTPTIYPNLLMDAFRDNMDLSPASRSEGTLEISRFCSDAAEEKNIMGLVIAGLLEIGIEYNLHSYVSFSNVNIRRRAKKFGWPTNPLGNVARVGDADAQALSHIISQESYDRAREILGFSESVLVKDELKRCPLKKPPPIL